MAANKHPRTKPNKPSVLPHAHIYKRSPEREALFLEAIAGTNDPETGRPLIPAASVTVAALRAGVGRLTVYEWRDKDRVKYENGDLTADFHLRWIDAAERGTDQLEQEAQRRAMVGYERPVYQGGVMVGTTTEYSDTLMQIMLKGRRKSVYGTDKIEHSGPDGGSIPISIEVEFVEGKAKK